MDHDSPVLCACGCGEPAPIATKTKRSAGHVKGQPMRYIKYHSKEGGRPRGPSEVRAVRGGTLVPLTQGKATLIDSDDTGRVEAVKWFVQRGRNGRYEAQSRSYGKTVRLADYLIGHRDGLVIDHKNGNPLDNRKGNLRHITQTENALNRRTYRTNTSAYRGVSHYDYKGQSRWVAYINARGKRHHLGYFDSPEEAFAARQAAEVQIHGEFRRSNNGY